MLSRAGLALAGLTLLSAVAAAGVVAEGEGEDPSVEQTQETAGDGTETPPEEPPSVEDSADDPVVASEEPPSGEDPAPSGETPVAGEETPPAAEQAPPADVDRVVDEPVDAVVDGPATDLTAYEASVEAAGDTDELLAALLPLAAPDADVGLKLAAVRTLGAVRDQRALALVLELAESIDPMLLASTSVHATLADAIAAQVGERIDLSSIGLMARDADPRVLPAVASGVARSDSPEALGFLTSLLGRTEELDAELLHEIERAAARGTAAAPSDQYATLRTLRGYLEAEAPDLRRGAAAALGSLGDVESLSGLTRLLDDADPLVVASAHSALVRLAGSDQGTNADRWIAWHEEELRWWSDVAPDRIDELQGDDPGAAHRALGSLVEHPFWRQQLVEAIGPLTKDAERPIAPAACVALGRLGSRLAIPWLVDALLAREPEVRDRAVEALRLLTGRDHGDDYVAWSDAYGS